MTHLQRLQVRASEISQRANKLLGQETLAEEEKTELDALGTEDDELQPKLRAALRFAGAAGEGDGEGGDGDGEGEGEGDAQQRQDAIDAELRELHGIGNRAQLTNYVRAALAGSAIDGAELEFNQALGIQGGGAPVEVPLAMLLPVDVADVGDEEPQHRADGDGDGAYFRADAVTDLNATNSPKQAGRFLERIFAWAACRWLGVSFESVPIGERVHHVFASGSTADTLARGGALDAAEAGINAIDMKPNRLTAGYLFELEDVARLPALEARLRSDLSMVMSDQMDAAVLGGDAGLKTATGLMGLAGDSNVELLLYTASGFAEHLGLVNGLIDGLYARTLADVRIAYLPLTYREKILDAAKADQQTLFELLKMRGLMMETSSNVKTAGATIAATEVFAVGSKRVGLPGSAVASVWPSMQLIRDPYTKSREGRVRLTAISLWDFAVLRAANWFNLEAKTLA